MQFLSECDVLLLKFALASSIAYSVQHVVSRAKKVPALPLISNTKSRKQESSQITAPTRSIKKKLDQTHKSCVVFYGSQTGTAEKLATIFSKEAQARFGIESMVADLEDYDYETLLSLPTDTIAVFMLATYGEGEPTDNAIAFNQYCSSIKSKSHEPAAPLHYSLFGLGNSSYQYYNSMVRRADSALSCSGAHRLGDVGFGDDGKGTIEEDFLTWKDETLPILAKHLGLSERDNKFKAIFNVEEHDYPTADTFLGEPNKMHLRSKVRGPYTGTNPLPAPIAFTRQLFAGGGRQCLHMEFNIKGSTMTYETGDHLAVWASNSDVEVARFLEVFALSEKKDLEIKIQSRDPTVKIPIPANTTYDAAARYYLDICAPVSRHLLTLLTAFAADETSKYQLSRLSTDGPAFQNEVRGRRLNIAQLLESFGPSLSWNNVPVSLLLENLGKLQPRYYSISSSSIVSKKRISITAVVESQKDSSWSHEFKGVATNYLLAHALNVQHTLSAGNTSQASQLSTTHQLEGPRQKYSQPTALIHVRRSKFRLPSKISTPVIMIGPGTGVAPFRAFTQERALQSSIGKSPGRTLLFYGCRRRDEDFLYENEWKASIKSPSHTTFADYLSYRNLPVHSNPGHSTCILRSLERKGGFMFSICLKNKHQK